jgi:hypothetical protein
MNSRIARPQAAIIPPENAVMIKPFGLDMKVLLTTEATRGAISVVMAWHKPGEGPPNHIHFGQEEMFFTIDGTYEISELATGGEFAGERAIEVSREFDTNFPVAHQRAGARAAGSLHRAINQ